LLIFGKGLFEKGSYADALTHFEMVMREGAGTKPRIDAFRGIVGAMSKLGRTDALLERIDEFQKEFIEEGISSEDRLEAFRSIAQTLADLRKVEALLERIDEFKKEFTDIGKEYSEICQGWYREESHLNCNDCDSTYSCKIDDVGWFFELGRCLVTAPTERMWCFQCKKVVAGLVPRKFVFSKDFQKKLSELQSELEKTPQFLVENKFLSILFGRTVNPEYQQKLDAVNRTNQEYLIQLDASRLYEDLSRNIASPICVECGSIEIRSLLTNPIDSSRVSTTAECCKCGNGLVLVSRWKQSFYTKGQFFSHSRDPEFYANIVDLNGKTVRRRKLFRAETKVINCSRDFIRFFGRLF
jgi:hypothetical protein